MKAQLIALAAIVTVLLPDVAAADDPHDPAMRSAAARARDHEIIRQLNLDELAQVRERDARYAEVWRARSADDSAAANPEYSRQSSEYEHAAAAYASDQKQYERQLAQWHRAVVACRAGDYSYCGG